jgi:flavin-dependent dehydrogenase
VIVHATVRYKHSLLPETTTLEDKMGCRVKITRDEMERAEMSGVDMILKKRVGSDEDNDDGDGEDEYEERVREARVLGAPWL